jgi:hypothetical protein
MLLCLSSSPDRIANDAAGMLTAPGMWPSTYSDLSLTSTMVKLFFFESIKVLGTKKLKYPRTVSDINL